MKLIPAKYRSPKLFIVDAAGAFITIILLFILYHKQEFIGMPRKAISLFIDIAGVFFLYSIITYFMNPSKWKDYLRIIAVFNVLYCFITIYYIFLNSQTLRLLGWLYFIGEILIILTLSIVELNVANETGKDI